MHIGVDATCWLLARGFGRHARCLVTALREIDTANDYTFFTDSDESASALRSIGTVTLVPASTPTVEAAAAHGRRAIADLVRMSLALADRSIDVLFFPTVYSYVPVVSRARKLMMFHDVTAERYPDLTLDGGRARLFWRAKIALARRQADAIATVSDYSRRALAVEFGIDERRLHVIGEAADPVFRRLDDPRPTPALAARGLDRSRRTIVYVGGFSPHKNLVQLVEVFGRLAEDPAMSDVVLVLVGGYEHEAFFSSYPAVRTRVADLGLERSVVFAGFLADEDLVVLLNRATALALPSLTEGFGLPAIEAAACGCPVVATTESPLPGLLGGGGVYVDPRSPDQLEAALREVLSSPARQREMRQEGLAAAARLTWTAAARDLLSLFERMAGR